MLREADERAAEGGRRVPLDGRRALLGGRRQEVKERATAGDRSAPLDGGARGTSVPALPTTAIIEINYLFKIEGVRVLFARDKVCSALYRNKFLRVLLGEGDIYQCKYKSLPWSSGS